MKIISKLFQKVSSSHNNILILLNIHIKKKKTKTKNSNSFNKEPGRMDN